MFCLGCLNKFYNAGGAGVRFAILLDDLAENFPEDKLNRLKFLIECRIFTVRDGF